MNILVVCGYDLYMRFDSSFVHAQAKAYAALGHQVRALVMIPVWKKDWDGKRLSAPLQRRKEDGVTDFACRFLSLSNYGERRFNAWSSIHSVQMGLEEILDGFSADVVHAHFLTRRNLALGNFLREKTNCPLVITTHGSDTSIPVSQGRAAELKPICDQADAVAAVSTTLADKLRTCGTTTRIVTILNGFNIHALPKKQAKAELSFIQAGSLQEQKRPHITLRAFAMLRQAHPNAALCFVGQGPERSRLESMCRELGVSDGVRFTGQIPNPDVLAELSKARFFILPSVREGFGIVYLEAMACGCLVIGTEGEGIADLIASGENGFLVPPDNPEAIVQTVEWCLSHLEETAAIAERGRQDALALTWERNASEYIKLFKELPHEN